MENTYLSLAINNKLYAVDVRKVLEVLDMQEITYVPNTPDNIKGIINFRGEFLPVFESRKKFNLPDRPENDPYVIIIMDLSKDKDFFRIAALADKVVNVITVDDSEIKEVPAMSKEVHAECLAGIIRLDDEFVLLLDADKTFADFEVAQPLSEVS